MPTVREILRQIFHDELLKNYSFVGQKGKKKFSSLASCTVIIGKIYNTFNYLIKGKPDIFNNFRELFY